MKIAFNPSTVAALITPPNNKDITFDLRGRNIFARGVKFCGTDTWRDIKINNVSIGSNILDLRNGSNTTLTNTNGVVTINSTWRPVVDNLTSDSTTSSLSAKQGKILKSLIDGKSNSGHTHDDRYLRLTGGTMAGNALITFADSGSWGTDKGPQGARGGLYWTGQSDYAKLYAEETVGDNLDLVIQFGDDNSNGLSIRNKANTQTSYISAGGVITTGTFKGNLDWSYITNKPSSYTPSAHTHAWNSLTHSSTIENQAILTNGKANGWKLYTLNISRWDNAANNAHSHANKSVLDGITSALVNNWNVAYTFVNTISGTDTDKVINKWDEIVNFLAGITEDNKLNTLLNSKLSIQQLSTKDILTTKTNNALFWVNTIGTASSITTGPFTDHPYALLSVTNYNQNTENSKFFYRSRLAFSSTGDIKVASCHHENVYKQDETWYNVLTSKNSGISGSTIKLNGTSITVYSSSTADGRYVKKTGDTMSGVLTIDTTNFGALTIKRNDDANGASIQFRGKSSVYGYIGLNNSTKDKQFLRWNSDTSKTYTILDTSSTYTSNGKGVINGTTITQVDNATNSTNSTNARKLVNWYSTRPTSLNAQFGDGSLRIFYATSSTTEGKPAEDSHILHLAWDNNGGWDAQLAVHTRSGKVSTRAQNSGTWQPWKTLAFTTDIPSSLKNPYSLNVFGVTYDGSAAKVVSPSNFISQVNEATSTVTDGTMLITSWASNSGFADTNAVNIPYKRKAIHLWEYIKAKTDSLYATRGHNHDDRYLKLTGGTMSGTIYRNSGGTTISGRDHAIIRQTHAPGGSSWNPIACVDTETGTWTLGHLSSGSNNTDFNFCFSTNADYNAGNNNGNYVTLRNKVGTIALLSDIPSSLKNPHALTISLNGTSQGPYDGSTAKNINITPSSIGAATSGHNHDDRYYTKAESNAKYITDITTSVNKLTFTKNGSNIDKDIKVNVVYSQGNLTNISDKNATTKASSGLFIYNSYNQVIGTNSYSSVLSINTGGTIQIAGNWGDDQSRNLYWRSQSDRAVSSYPWKSWRTILDSENYSSTLDSRYYTESEVNNLLDAKLNRQNLSYGTWNPRDYNLAADYSYNGGDLSISESGGKIHISVDGYFWQNEGQYRVLDTSDISSIRGGLTLYQHLSATDATRYPIVWGGSDHKNTNNSTGSLYKSYDKLSWQTSSQTLYATNIQTENIKHLSIGGGIYWNPYVESASDGSDSASITLVRQGVAGGTTLVLSQMNDANDTIQFKTNGSARLYHNSYPILTTQNTYVSNNKGYINGTEITQVNNADKVDNRHAISTTPNTGIIYKAAIYTSSSLTSYWVRLASIPSISQNSEFIATIHVQSGHSNPGRSAILLVYLRGSASSFTSKSFKIYCNSNYDPNRFRLYYKDSDKTSEIWYQTTGQWDGIITTVISQSSEGSLYEGLTLYSGSITAVQTPSMSTYLSAQVSTITDNILGNAATATKLQTARSIWGHSFNGTADINGTIYINNNNSSEGAIRLNNNINSNARISAIDSQVIFNTDAAIRFGGTSWDWNVWAGLKYTHSNKTIYLGIADGSVFNANSAQSGGSLRFPGISNVYATTFNGSLSGNASTATTLQTTRTLWGQSFNGSNNVSGNMSSVGQITFSALSGTNGRALLYQQMADNDYFRIYAGGTASNSGYVEIATADDGNEPIYIRQYTGVFSSVKRTLTLLDANGYTHFPSYINIGGNENNNSSPDRVWGSNGSDSYLRSYRTSALRVSYASSAGNADTVDGEHASAFTRIVGRNSIGTSGTAPYNYIHLFRIANSNSYSTLDCEIDFRTRYHSAKIEIRIATNNPQYGVGNSSISIVKKVINGRSCNFWVLQTVQSSNYNYYDVYYESGAWNSGSYGIIFKGSNGVLVFEHKGINLTSLPDKVIPVSNNVATSATKLQTPRTIWGQSFDGTGNVDNTLRIRQTTGNYCEGIRIQTADSTWATIILGATGDSGTNANAWSIHRKSDNNFAISRNSSDGTNGLVMTSVGMGLGTTAPTQRLDVHGNIRATGQIIREGSSQIWVNGRRGALLRETTSTGYHTLWSLKTTNGSWDFGEYNSSGWNNIPVLSYITDTNFNSGNNTTTYQIKFPLDSGTIALTKNIPTSLKSPYSLTLKANGTTLAIYDGSSAKEANFTYANVGAASASHSHTYIVAEDLRSKYPGQILDPQRMKLSFLSASTLGIKNDGLYYDVITVRSYIDSSGGSDNALLFSKNSNSLYHTRFAFGSTSSWGSPLLIIDSGNIGSQSVAYASKAGSVAWDSITGKPSSFTPSSHTHSWTSITDKLVAGNEFNIVNAGFNNRMWFNYVPINDKSKTATILDYGFGNGHQGYATVTASGFVKNGSSSSYVLLGDGGHKTISSLSVNYANSAGNADTVDRYHANTIYNAPSFTVNNSNTSNTYILLATITISGTSLGCAEFTTLFQNRECLDSSSFILSGAIRRNSTTSVTATLSYITLHTKTPRNIYLRSNDGVTFLVYIQSAASAWTTYYRAIPIVDSGNITYSNTGTTSPISGSVLNITATKGGNVNYASSAGNADTLDSYHANGLLTALSNSNNGVSITIGGTTKSISNISVNHANSAGSANTATKLTSSAGNAALPIYFSDGKPVACTASSVFSNLSNSGNNLSITVAGQNRTLTVGYATSAGSATKVIVNQHTTNDTNYPLVWSNQSNTNSVTENQLYKSWSDLYYNPKNKRLTVGGSVVASSFIKSDGTSQQLLRADGGIATFNWSGQSGQPTWLWGGNNQHSYYVYNPSNFRVAYATSAGSADTLDGVHLSGIFTAFGNNGHNITATIGGTTKSFLVNWAADSDKLDGYHASDLLTSVTNTNNGISVTVGGTTKSVSNISVNYASNAGSVAWDNITGKPTIPNPTNYYWANVKISTSSSTTTSPTVSNLTATSSIRMGNIYLQNTNEINSTSGIHLNYQNSGNISLCVGGGNVGIGAISPAYKLNVNGDIHSSGTINCNALNVGSTLSIKDSVISCSASDISIESKESGSLLINSSEVLRYDSDFIHMSNKTSFVNRLGLGTGILGITYTTDDVTVLIGSLRESSFFEFRPAMDGQLLFLKIGKLYSNIQFYCTARNCEVIKANNFNTYLARNDKRDCFGDGSARIFIYKQITERWYEFYCG